MSRQSCFIQNQWEIQIGLLDSRYTKPANILSYLPPDRIHRITPIRYNRTMVKYFSARGDEGQTDQLGGGRISKAHLRVQALGALDEASAALGLARAQAEDQDIEELVKTVQIDLYRVMTLVSLAEPQPEKYPDLKAERVSWLEERIAHYSEGLEQPKTFILPGENILSASFDMARTIVRRAERRAVALDEAGLLFSEASLPYLNRLSSLCYVLELWAAQHPPGKMGTGL